MVQNIQIQTCINGNPFKFRKWKNYKYKMDTTIKIDLQQVVMYLIMGLLLASVIWVGKSINTFNSDLAVIKSEIAHINEDLATFTQYRYTSIDANKDITFINTQIDGLDHRVERLENKVTYSE